ncbi:MAG: preprotein translocase subunit SecY [candidate division WWE3 bacterium]|nr:preprotein translocase subunit SecY [candidate division WWE3 bacterium]
MIDKIIRTIRNMWEVPELRRRILFTILILALLRVLSNIPLPGVDVSKLRDLLSRNAFFGLFDLFSGGNLQHFSIASLSLNPYITASVIFQLLGMALPKIEALQKEPGGYEKINQWTRLLTVPLAIVQAVGLYFLLSKQINIFGSLQWWELGTLIITLVAGTMIMMWLGELLTEYGIGNGISVVITAGILSRLPSAFSSLTQTITPENSFNLIALGVAAVAIIIAIVAVNEGERRIPIHVARRTNSTGGYSEAPTHLPLKVNQAGVMPIIFAVAVVMLPASLGQFLQRFSEPQIRAVANWLIVNFTPQKAVYNIFYFVMVVAFTFFYTVISFNPEKIADEFMKSGRFIPGIRPGKPTVNFLNWILARITLSGAIFLGLVAVLPSLMQNLFATAASLAIGGTSVLIVVSVVLESVKQVESLLVTRDYDSFLK